MVVDTDSINRSATDDFLDECRKQQHCGKETGITH